MSSFAEQPTEQVSELRVVVDAQIVLAMFLIYRDRPGIASPKRTLLHLLGQRTFRWLWTDDIIADYQKGADAIESNRRLSRQLEFDRSGFQLLLAALQLFPPVNVSISTLRAARRRILEAPRAAQRDIEDAVYLACAVDGDAHLLTSEDSDLRSLGTYEGIRIVGWLELKDELLKHGLTLQ